MCEPSAGGGCGVAAWWHHECALDNYCQSLPQPSNRKRNRTPTELPGKWVCLECSSEKWGQSTIPCGGPLFECWEIVRECGWVQRVDCLLKFFLLYSVFGVSLISEKNLKDSKRLCSVTGHGHNALSYSFTNKKYKLWGPNYRPDVPEVQLAPLHQSSASFTICLRQNL